MNELGIFRREFRDIQYFTDEIQMIISLIKDELQNFIEKLLYQIKIKKNNYGWIVMELKHC